MYRLMVSDIDGTLTDSEGALPAKLVRKVQALRKQGGLFTIATGRSPQHARDIVRQLGIDLPVIYLNGAKVEDARTAETLWQHTLPEDFLVKFMPWVTETSSRVVLFREDGSVVRREAGGMDAGDAHGQHGQPWYGSLTGIHKVLVMSPQSPEKAFREYAGEVADSARWVLSYKDCWDIMPVAASKGAAVELLAASMGIFMSEVVAIGDNMNDIEMVSQVGLGCAVENAHPALKMVAGRVTHGKCNEGVCEILDELLIANRVHAFMALAVPASN